MTVTQSQAEALVARYDELFHNYACTAGSTDRELCELNRIAWETQQRTMITLFGHQYVAQLATECGRRHHAHTPSNVVCDHEPGAYGEGLTLPPREPDPVPPTLATVRQVTQELEEHANDTKVVWRFDGRDLGSGDVDCVVESIAWDDEGDRLVATLREVER
jgi:hypothetical protein